MIPGKTSEVRYEPKVYDFSNMSEEKRPPVELVNQSRHVVRSYLILYRTPSHLFQPPALKVLDVEKESNAARAEIQAGDYIVSYHGIQPDTIEALRVAIKQAKDTGQKSIATVIYREAKEIVKELEPGRMGVTLIEQ
jgi:S1-C subfamily serine protease